MALFALRWCAHCSSCSYYSQSTQSQHRRVNNVATVAIVQIQHVSMPHRPLTATTAAAGPAFSNSNLISIFARALCTCNVSVVYRIGDGRCTGCSCNYKVSNAQQHYGTHRGTLVQCSAFCLLLLFVGRRLHADCSPSCQPVVCSSFSCVRPVNPRSSMVGPLQSS